MTPEEKVALLKKAGVWDVIGFPSCIDKLFDLVAAHAKSDQINTAYQQGCEDMKRRMEKRMQQLESQLQLCQTAVADEREACAKVCEENKWGHGGWCAKAIRARSN